MVFGVTWSPFLLNATLEYHISTYLKDDSELKTIDSLYVDDLSTGEQTKEKASTTNLKLNEIMKMGGFDSRKWCSNPANLWRKIQDLKQESDNA